MLEKFLRSVGNIHVGIYFIFSFKKKYFLSKKLLSFYSINHRNLISPSTKHLDLDISIDRVNRDFNPQPRKY